MVVIADKVQTFTCHGSFPAQYLDGVPTLKFGDVSCELVANDIQTLKFAVPASIFPTAADIHKYTRRTSWWKPD